MHESFSTSRASGDLIWEIVVLAWLAILAIAWAVEDWQQIQQGSVDSDHGRGVEADRESAGDQTSDEDMRFV